MTFSISYAKGTENWVMSHEGARLEFAFGPGNRCEIIDIEVPAEGRRKGVGRKMVDELCQMCKRRNVAVVYAITRHSNRIAQKFYESMRFDVSVLRDFYEPGVQAVDALLYSRSPIGPV